MSVAPAMASTIKLVGLIRERRISSFRFPVQRPGKIGSPTRLMTASEPSICSCHGPEIVTSPSTISAWSPKTARARAVLRPGGRIITLIKPHYEADEKQLRRGVLDPELARQSLDAIRGRITAAGAAIEQLIESPIPGQKGNIEFLALLSLSGGRTPNGK